MFHSTAVLSVWHLRRVLEGPWEQIQEQLRAFSCNMPISFNMRILENGWFHELVFSDMLSLPAAGMDLWLDFVDRLQVSEACRGA